MVEELKLWLDAQNIDYAVIDNEVVDIPNFGKMFIADLSGVDSIFKTKDGDVRFNLGESPQELQDDGINYVAFPFGNNWYYYDLREEFGFNILKHIGKPKTARRNVPFVNLGVHTSYELLNASGSLEGLCRKAKWLGHTAVGICDRNTMAATLNLQKECAKAGLRHIFGYTLTMIQDESKVDVKIYALSNVGLQNLLNLQREVMVNSEDSTIEYSKLFAYVEGYALVFSERWDFERLFERMCRHTVEIAECADATFETGKMFMPEYMMHPDERERYGNRRAMFLKLLNEGLEEKISKSKHKVYRERLEEEVYIIESTDNVDYFLVQWDMVREAKRRGIATGIGRGSAGGSLVSYLLGITSIDPIKYALIFSRFLVPERCGLSWKDELTVLAPNITIPQGASYIEVEIDKNTYRLHPESELRIVRNGVEMTITADKLTDGNDILLDRRNCLWNLKEVAFQQ